MEILVSFDRVGQELSNHTKLIYLTLNFWDVTVEKVKTFPKMESVLIFVLEEVRRVGSIWNWQAAMCGRIPGPNGTVSVCRQFFQPISGL